MEVKEELYKAADRIECVDYRSVERAGEIEEALDSCVTRVGIFYCHCVQLEFCKTGITFLNSPIRCVQFQTLSAFGSSLF